MTYKQEVYDEQRILQLSNQRSRTIDSYTRTLGLDYSSHDGTDLYMMIKSQLDQKGNIVWIDLGGGNGIAQREAKLRLDLEGTDIERLETYNIDILEPDNARIKTNIKVWPDEYDSRLIEERYCPIFIQDDVTDAIFPKKADIITGIGLLCWVQDPLKVFSNSLSQLNNGGIIGFNKTDHIHYSVSPSVSDISRTDNYLFNEIMKNRHIITNLEPIRITDSSIILKKTGSVEDIPFKLESKYERFPGTHITMDEGFMYVYTPIQITKDSPSSGKISFPL